MAPFELVTRIDEEWPMGRRVSDLHDWSWCEIHRRFRLHGEVLAVVEDAATPSACASPLAVWASRKRRAIALPGGSFWRLDYIEVNPSERGGAFGAIAVALAATHALRQGADGILLGSVAELQKFWEAVGAQQRGERGWQPARGLLPFVIGPKSMAELAEMAHEHEIDKEDEG